MKTILALFLIIILPPLQVFAQTTTLEGFVTDAVGVPSSGFLPGQELLVLTRQGVVELRADGTTSLLFSRPLGYSLNVSNEEIFIDRGGELIIIDHNGELLRTVQIPGEAEDYLEYEPLPGGRYALLDNVNDNVYIIDGSGSLIATRPLRQESDNHAQNLSSLVIDETLYISGDGDKRVLSLDLGTYDVEVFRDLGEIEAGWIGALGFTNSEFYITTALDIYRFTESSGPSLVASLPDGNITGIALAYPLAWVTVNFTGEVYEVNLNSGSVSLLSSGLDYPRGIALSPEVDDSMDMPLCGSLDGKSSGKPSRWAGDLVLIAVVGLFLLASNLRVTRP